MAPLCSLLAISVFVRKSHYCGLLNEGIERFAFVRSIAIYYTGGRLTDRGKEGRKDWTERRPGDRIRRTDGRTDRQHLRLLSERRYKRDRPHEKLDGWGKKKIKAIKAQG